MRAGWRGRGEHQEDVHRESRKHCAQAKQALQHPWFDDLDMDAMNALENPAVLHDPVAA